MFVQLTSQNPEAKHCSIFIYKDMATSFNTSNKMVYPYFSRISYQLNKKEKMDAIK